MKTYSVKEIFYTLQGEGFHSGRPAVFCRFSGCNLWNGVEADRGKAECKICDTDFVGGKKYSLAELAKQIINTWPKGSGSPFIVFTGGEPGLQLDDDLIEALKREGAFIAVETNGTKHLPLKVDWVTLSPKTSSLTLKRANELKVLYPTFNPKNYEFLEAEHYYVSPTDAFIPEISSKNMTQAAKYCMENPKWRLSLQTHKILGLP